MATKTKKTKTPSKVKSAVKKLFTKSTPEQIEAKRWVKFAKEKGVTKPYFGVSGCVRRTSDGKVYQNPEEFFADGGATDWSNVHHIE